MSCPDSLQSKLSGQVSHEREMDHSQYLIVQQASKQPGIDELVAFCYTRTVTDTHSDTYPTVYYCASVCRIAK